jgi:hypothetical protein
MRMIPLLSLNIVRVNYVEYLGSSLGMIGIVPQALGHIKIDTYTPQFWFQWGNYLIIEPLPDVGTYGLNIYAACYPDSVMTSDSDLPVYLPVAFHESIYSYALAYSCLKLKRWQEATTFYMRYITNLQRKKDEFAIRRPDVRAMMDIPNVVNK